MTTLVKRHLESQVSTSKRPNLIAGVDETRMTVRAVISTPTLDREADILESAGAVLDNHMANPIVFFNHGLKDGMPGMEIPIGMASHKSSAIGSPHHGLIVPPCARCVGGHRDSSLRFPVLVDLLLYFSPQLIGALGFNDCVLHRFIPRFWDPVTLPRHVILKVENVIWNEKGIRDHRQLKRINEGQLKKPAVAAPGSPNHGDNERWAWSI